jgi:hypothetical protein
VKDLRFAALILLSCAPACVGSEGQGQSSTDAGSESSTGPGDGALDASSGTDGVAPAEGGPDAEAGGDAGEAGDSGPTPPVLPAVQTSHLQLWLTSDYGAKCAGASPSRLTVWSDQSGNHRDATTGSHTGPECGNHPFGSVGVPYFSAPPPAVAGLYVDETLDVDLSFLSGAEYTIFVVERRWADRPNSSPLGCLFLGTDAVPNETNPTHFEALQTGYVYYNGGPGLVIDLTGFGTQTPQPPAQGAVPTVGGNPPIEAAFDMFRFTHAGGLEVWINGKLEQSRPGDMPLMGALGRGAIGRSTFKASDTRYIGDIAEVIVFDTGLTSPAGDAGAMSEQSQIEQYLRNHWSSQPFAQF